jgi:hypothetical protein
MEMVVMMVLMEMLMEMPPPKPRRSGMSMESISLHRRHRCSRICPLPE